MVLLHASAQAFPVYQFSFSGSADGFGSACREEGLRDQNVKLSCAVLSPLGESQLIERVRSAAVWLQGEGELSLPQDGGLFRRAWVTGVSELVSKKTWGEFQVEFRCHPLLLGEWQEVALNTDCVIGGTAPVRGVLRTVMPDSDQTNVTFQYGSQSLTIHGTTPAGAVVEVDTSLNRVMVGGENANSSVPMRSRFFAVDAGAALISAQSDEGTLSGTFRFRQRWY